MKREYIGMIFIVLFALLLIGADYIFGEQTWDIVSRYIVVWLLIAYNIGQYSMKFPKDF